MTYAGQAFTMPIWQAWFSYHQRRCHNDCLTPTMVGKTLSFECLHECVPCLTLPLTLPQYPWIYEEALLLLILRRPYRYALITFHFQFEMPRFLDTKMPSLQDNAQVSHFNISKASQMFPKFPSARGQLMVTSMSRRCRCIVWQQILQQGDSLWLPIQNDTELTLEYLYLCWF